MEVSSPSEVAASASEIEGIRMGVAVVRDITRRKADEELAHQALHDSLTGLPNRAFLLNRIGEMTVDVERVAGVSLRCCFSTSTDSSRSMTGSAIGSVTWSCAISRRACKSRCAGTT